LKTNGADNMTCKSTRLRNNHRQVVELGIAGCVATLILTGCSESETLTEAADARQAPTQATIESRIKPVLTESGLQFRDLNGDGKLDRYEDWRLSPAERAEDLVARMTLAEKAGTMMHSTLPGIDGFSGRSEDGYDLEQIAPLLSEKHVTSYISRLSLAAETLSGQNNEVQELAEKTRLGIPVSISTDPRHHFQYVLGASSEGGGFSQWPEQLGFAALNDRELMRTFGDIARREYRAVGLQIALSPQADLATEPRWPRMTATFGSQAELASDMVGAYVAGFQGSDDELTADGVMTVVKHWVGYGASINGFDGHNYYGRYALVDGDTLQPHIDAFIGAFEARAGGVMPTYPILQGATVNGEPVEQVGAGFSKQLLTDLLRDQYNYQGVILSDWAITRDCTAECMSPTKPHTVAEIATPWGVESLSPYQRFVKGVNAGLDQFGGTDDAHYLVEAVGAGDLSEQRLDESVRRVLIAKFQQGLFENPYVDPAQAARIVGSRDFVARGKQAQREAQVLLENRDGLLPIAAEMRKVYLFGMAPEAATAAGLEVVDDPAAADFALIRTEAPHEVLHPNHFFGSRQHEGRLDYRDGDPAYEVLTKASAQVPTVFAIFLDRPAILGNVRDKADVILANFGASDTAVLDVVLGRATARGRLPFELPSSMAAVETQHPAIGDDSTDPLYPFGAGILPGN
jgi:beta-glucosidase